MALESFPFSSSPIATEGQWSRLVRHLVGDGVFLASPSDAALKVTAAGTSTVTLQPGDAAVNGFYFASDSVYPMAVPTNFGNASPRVDLIVLRCSQTANSVAPVYKVGGTSAPSLAVDRNDVFEIPVAQVTVAAGAAVAMAGSVVDLRYGPGLPVAVGPGAPPASYGVQRYLDGVLALYDGAKWRPVLLADSPRCRAYQTGTGEVLAHNTPRDLILNAETYDTAGMHATAGDPAFRKVIAPVAGVYEATAAVSFDGNDVGVRAMIIVKNGTIPAGGGGSGGSAVARWSGPPAPATEETAIQCGGEVTMAAGDYLSIRATQMSGGTLGLNPGSDRVFLQMKWVRDS